MDSIELAYQAGVIIGYILCAFLPGLFLFSLYMLFKEKKKGIYKLCRFSFTSDAGEIIHIEGKSGSSAVCSVSIYRDHVSFVESENKEELNTIFPLQKIFRIVSWEEKTSVFLVLTSLFSAWTLLQAVLLHYTDMTVLFNFALFFFLMYAYSRRTILRIETIDLQFRVFYYRKGFGASLPIEENKIRPAIEYMNDVIKESKQSFTQP